MGYVDRSRIFECVDCGHHEIVHANEIRQDGRRCTKCGGHSTFMGRLKRKENKYDCLLCNKGTSKFTIKNCYGDEKKICAWCYEMVKKSMA